MSENKQLTYTIHKLACLLDKMAGKTLHSKFDLSFSQVRILIAIHKKGQVSQKEIASFWEVTEAAVSRHVDNLLKMRLVQAQENKDNRREHMLSLTKRGEDQLKKSRGMIDSEYDKLYSILTKQERDVMTKALNKLLGTLCGDENFSCSKTSK